MKPKRGRPRKEETKVWSFRVPKRLTEAMRQAVQRFIDSIIP